MSLDTPRRRRLAWILLLVLAAATRFWGLGWGLPHTYHVDENAFGDKAIRFFYGDLDPHFFHVGTLHMYALAGMWKVYQVVGGFESTDAFVSHYQKNPTTFYLIGRSLSALLGVGSVLLVFLLGLRMAGLGAGFAAGLFLTFSPEHVKISHAMLPDGPTLFFLLLTFFLIWRIYEKGRALDYALAGLTAGIAMAMKYAGHMMVIPLLFAHTARILELGLPKKKIFLHPPLFLFGATFLLTFAAGCPYAVLDFPRFWADFKWQSGHLMSEGHFGSSMRQPAWLFYLQYGFRDNLGRWVQYLAFGGVILALARRKAREWILLSYPLVLFVLIGMWKTRATRYFLPLAPFFILLAAPFVEAAAAWLAPRLRALVRRTGPAPRTAAVLTLLFALVAVAPSAVRVVRYDASVAGPDTRTQALEWIRWNIPPGETIAHEAYDPPLPGKVYALFYRNSLSDVDLNVLARGGVQYVVVSDINYARFTRYPKEFPERAAFYFDLEKEATLIKSFVPTYDEDLLDLHNPTIKIYRLGRTPDFRFPGHFERLAAAATLKKSAGGGWTLEASIEGRLGPYVGERVGEPYARLLDSAGREIARLVLREGPVPSGDFQASASRKVADPPEGTRIALGYLYDLAPNPLRVPPEQPFFKEAVLPKRLDAAARREGRLEASFRYGPEH
ncbi:MAG: phospholipid carrier-dependent glycosyltransferase [Candidatus Aminicenantes bacterium]|nr:phospholipid carrier-dependent glycosyltransferase [Candidatus Aminicenantes bacterium]